MCWESRALAVGPGPGEEAYLIRELKQLLFEVHSEAVAEISGKDVE